MLDIRLARPDDAQAVHLILQKAWGDSLLFDMFINHISSSEHQVFVAVDAGKIAGFLSAFLLPTQTPRWEIDLLAVRLTSQRKGIGTSLIEKALTYGANLGASLATASIRVNNHASQRTFSKAGFATDAQARNLFLWDPLAYKSPTNVPETVHFIPVDTLTYRGLWIEGFVESQLSREEQHNVIRSARNSIFHENRLSTGISIPDSLKQTIAPSLLTTATNHGWYHRWQYTFK